jgi:hypothetical protein
VEITNSSFNAALSYLGNILRSWQRAVVAQTTLSFPRLADVVSTTRTNSPNVIHYEHHGSSWRSSEFISVRADQKTLVVHLANDGYLYIHDQEMETVQIGKPNDRQPTEPRGWAVLKTSRRESAFNQLQDFEIFAGSWFDSVPYRKIVLYNVAARRIDSRVTPLNSVEIEELVVGSTDCLSGRFLKTDEGSTHRYLLSVGTSRQRWSEDLLGVQLRARLAGDG